VRQKEGMREGVIGRRREREREEGGRERETFFLKNVRTNEKT